MKQSVTIVLASLLFLPTLVDAQPVRNGDDIVWARDVAGAVMTLDGQLNEAVWPQAETIDLVWDGPHAFPGSGQRTEGNPVLADPSDPNNGTIYLLRDGNTLWLGAMVQDKSVGGRSGFFVSDGLIMNFLDRIRLVDERKDEFGEYTANFFQGNRTEFFYNWRVSGDTTDAATTYDDGSLVGSGLPSPGISARFHGFYNGYPAGDTRDPRDAAAVAVWDAVTVVDGISNDDTHGDDVGYTFEMKVDLAALGYDFTQAGGDKMAWNVALLDNDYEWPNNPDLAYRSRVWWQNQWGNNFNEGAGYLHGAPGVTVNSGPLPDVTEPEFTIPNATLLGDPTIDGVLDETAWDAADPLFYIQYQGDQAILGQNPEIAKYYVFYFKPNISGANPPPPVLDPSVARVSMIFNGNRLFVGVDVDDQAVSGTQGEGGRDGIRLFFRDRDSLTTEGIMQTMVFEFQIDSSGVITYGAEALNLQTTNPGAVTAAVALKGSSTVADPSDIDEGYQIEISIDLVEALGYPDGLGDHRLYTAMNFFDGDYLDPFENSYATRTWVVQERSGTAASIYGYMNEDVQLGVAVDPGADLPTQITLEGNYPNPFNPGTTLRYVLPSAGEVTVAIFNVLGQKVAELVPGPQAAGKQQVAFNAESLSSGVYLYKVFVRGANEIESPVGRMTLVK